MGNIAANIHFILFTPDCIFYFLIFNFFSHQGGSYAKEVVDVSCIMTLGTHRYMTESEMTAKVGEHVFGRIRVFNHQWRNPDALVDLDASGRGTPLQVNRAVAEADVVIGIGAVVPITSRDFRVRRKSSNRGFAVIAQRRKPTSYPAAVEEIPFWALSIIQCAVIWTT